MFLRKWTFLGWVCLALIGLYGIGGPMELMLCFGDDHIRVEAAERGVCRDQLSNECGVEGTHAEACLDFRPMSCGECVDVPLTIGAAAPHVISVRPVPTSASPTFSAPVIVFVLADLRVDSAEAWAGLSPPAPDSAFQSIRSTHLRI